MKRIILIYGLIAGVIISALMLLTIPLTMGHDDMKFNYLLGYVTMVVALSTVFFAIKAYRDKELGGHISFGRGFLIGLYITLIAAVLYAASWEVYYQMNGAEFMSKYAANQIQEMRSAGASEEAIQKEMANMQKMMQWYKNPIFRFGFTMIELLPVGIIISLISAAILRKKEVLPAV